MIIIKKTVYYFYYHHHRYYHDYYFFLYFVILTPILQTAASLTQCSEAGQSSGYPESTSEWWPWGAFTVVSLWKWLFLFFNLSGFMKL